MMVFLTARNDDSAVVCLADDRYRPIGEMVINSDRSVMFYPMVWGKSKREVRRLFMHAIRAKAKKRKA